MAKNAAQQSARAGAAAPSAEDFAAGLKAGSEAALLTGAGSSVPHARSATAATTRLLLASPIDVVCHLIPSGVFVVSDVLPLTKANEVLSSLAYVAAELVETALVKMDDEQAERMVNAGAAVLLGLVATLARAVAEATPPADD